MDQPSLLDWKEPENPSGEDLKARGMLLASRVCPDWLNRARDVGAMLAAKHGEVTIDQVKKLVGNPPNPNASGSVFKDSRFKFTGRYVKTERVNGHARMIRVWELAD